MEELSVGPWGCEKGTPFCHRINNGRIQNVTLLYEGGFKSLAINNSIETTNDQTPASVIKPQIQPANNIRNSNYSQAIGTYWRKSFDDCKVKVISGSTGVGCDNESYVIVSKRKGPYYGIEQDITGEVCAGGVYEVLAHVSVEGGNGQEFQMRATIKLENMKESFSVLRVGSVFVKNGRWMKLECWFHLNEVPKSVLFYIEGPPANMDLCIGPVSIRPVTRQFVVNLDQDEYLTGISGYFRRIKKGMSKVLSSLSFLTNRTEYGPYGFKEGTFFSFKTNNGEIIGFHGTFGNYLNSIGCHVKPPSIPDANV